MRPATWSQGVCKKLGLSPNGYGAIFVEDISPLDVFENIQNMILGFGDLEI